jgi:nicotinamidase/pyrazinamidase
MTGVGMNLQKGDALIVVDVQRDFLPGGSLAVPDGDRVVPVLNHYLRRFQTAGLPIVATRDWHPPNHCSFAAQGGLWPPHCIKESCGAEFAEQLELPAEALLISKGTKTDTDAYSGFDGTDLEQRMRDAGVQRVFVGGLATDYCVLATVKDAVCAGFEVFVLGDAIRAVDAGPGDGDKALEAMLAAGAVIIEEAAIDADG